MFLNCSKTFFILITVGLNLPFQNLFSQEKSHLIKKQVIANGISPKSIVSNNNGVFAAQNMMYRHHITLYQENGSPIAKITDQVDLKKFGFNDYKGTQYRGAPVEGIFTNDGKYLWVSNYHMTGEGFDNPGCDECIGKSYDPSFVYKINVLSNAIENVVKVGAVPKFLAISPNEKYLLVSNWVSSDVSVIDLTQETEIKRVNVGPHPRGITISHDNLKAYITVMGGNKIAVINLENFEVENINSIGKSPRSILIGKNDSVLYISMNSGNELVKYDLSTGLKKHCATPPGPRSMVLSPEENYLYIVNYFDNSFSKINVLNMEVVETKSTADKPIGIAANWKDSEIWIACYSGTIEIYKDFERESFLNPPTFFGLNLAFDFQGSKKEQNTFEEAKIDLKEKELTPLKSPIIKQSFALRTIGQNVLSQSDSTFHIIIGAFEYKNNAIQKCSEMIKEGYTAQVIQGSKYHYVSIKSTTTIASAENHLSQLKKVKPAFSSAWILPSKN